MALTVKQKIEALWQGRKIRDKNWSEGDFIYWSWDGEKLIDEDELGFSLWNYVRALFDPDHEDYDNWEYFEQKTCDNEKLINGKIDYWEGLIRNHPHRNISEEIDVQFMKGIIYGLKELKKELKGEAEDGA